MILLSYDTKRTVEKLKSHGYLLHFLSFFSVTEPMQQRSCGQSSEEGDWELGCPGFSPMSITHSLLVYHILQFFNQ